MKILKSETFGSHKLATIFVNEQKITKEDLVIITSTGDIAFTEYAVFFMET